MSKVYSAKIKWLEPEQGGRQTGLPSGDKYAPIVIIKGSKIRTNKVSWSLFVFNKTQIADYETIAEVWYLSEKAPDNLRPGIKFDLFEGRRLVASGIIL